jgi:pilus assembly protein Flp/PilA
VGRDVERSVREAVLRFFIEENKMNKFKNFTQDQSGTTAIEYALIASAMALALVTAMPSLGNVIKNKFVNIGTKITSGT